MGWWPNTVNTVAMLRVKNEARWIKRCLDSIAPLCNGGMLVFDDHSSDDTARIASDCGATIIMSPFEGLQESRDKNLLLGLAMRTKAEWVISIDGDEELRAYDLVNLASAMQTTRCTALSLPVWYLWDREDQMRVDGVYGDFHRESVFRPREGAWFDENKGPNLHCGNVPRVLRQNRQIVNAPLLHYGYMHCEDRVRKLAWYRERDPNNEREDNYRHIAQGDVPEIPASAKLKHGGPLELCSFTEWTSRLARTHRTAVSAR